MLKVVIFNGGRGASSIIPQLLATPGVSLTSVINAFDDGKSTGEIRDFFNVLGPSDIRKVQELMLPNTSCDYQSNLKLFQYRFGEGITHDDAVLEIKTFVSGSQNSIVGIEIFSPLVIDALRVFLGEFLSALHVIEIMRKRAFNFRDCSLMNCVYVGAFLKFNRNLDDAIRFIERLFGLTGSVLATSLDNRHLVALREDGEVLFSEAEIVELRSNVPIERIFLLDDKIEKKSFEGLNLDQKRYFLTKHHCGNVVSPSVHLAIMHADLIIFAPGTQHSSLYPTYLCSGLAEAIQENRKAFKAFIINIGADYETPSFRASDYLKGAFRYLTLPSKREFAMHEFFDLIIANDCTLPLKNNESYVEFDRCGFSDVSIEVLLDNFESRTDPGKHDGPKVIQTLLAKYNVAAITRRLGV